MKAITKNSTRRNFFGFLAKSAATLGLTSVVGVSSLKADALNGIDGENELESWFDNLKGRHKMVFDAVSPNEGFQTIWAFTFMKTNNMTGTPDNDLGVMIVLRGKAIGLALQDSTWKKYKLGKLFKLIDLATNAPSERNLFYDPAEGEMPDPGISIKKLLERGVMFCVCDTAMTMNSRQVAKANGVNPDEVKKEWLASMIPGIKVVPAGVLALNRAQERGASYCYAG
jgi:intracellular sulfur oxidation DsrE/DsrF family protein